MIQAGALFVALLMMLSVTALVVLSSPQPIEAVAGDDVTVDVGQEVAFDASGSTGAEPVQFLWFFGNGDAELGGLPSLSTDREATFAYGEEGVYEAILIVTDGLGRVDVDSRVVTVRNVLPAAVLRVDAFAGEVVEVQEDEAIAFDGSRSEDTEDLMYDWDFGDGEEGAGAVVEHAYASAGRYVARLEVMDPKGARDRAAIVVQVANVAPTALASFPSEAAEDETVLFDASASVDTPSDLVKLTYVWNLGDRTVKLGREVEHTFGLSGEYPIHLMVIDDNGASSEVQGTITILNERPTAVLPQVLVAEEGATVFFDASASEDTPSDVPVLNYTWDFDLDGRADAHGFRSTHVFDDEGSFVDLDVVDDDGAASSTFTRVQVANVPPSAGIVDAFRLVDVNLTVAGTPGHTITITIFEASAFLAQGSSTRLPGDPAGHSVAFEGLHFTLAESFGAVMVYEPFAGELGANPAWLNLSFEDGSHVRLFHNFNVVQEETHTWIVDLDPHMTQVPVHLVGYAYDPGSDDLTLRWNLGDGTTHISSHPSSGIPTRATNEIVHTFGLGTFTIEFRVEDEDGGLGRDEAVVSSSEGALTIDNLRPRAPLGGRLTVAEDGVVTFEAVGQDTASDRDTLSYRWSFRDGAEALGRMAEHAFAQAGTYHALLVVTDDSGEATLDSVQVEVRNVSPLGAIVPIDPAVEDTLLLFDGTSTVDTPSDALTLAFRWTFGDGSVGVGPVVSHAFPKAANYVVTLVVQDDNGAFSEASVEVSIGNVAPVASFEGPSTLFVEEAVPFLSTSEDTPSDDANLDLAWALGDGTTAAGRELVHAFLAPGTFSVELTVTDDDGEVGLVAGTVEVQNRPPTAHIPFDLFMVYGEEGRASFRGLGFNGLSNQGSLSFSWDFGDGSTGAGTEIEHAYGASGSFVLTLTVEDPHGGVGTDTAVVNVILDGDLDGLPDLYESQVADTDPAAADTDEDGILDPFEILVFGTDPLLQDTDFDAWTDFEEVFAVHGYMTEPLDADSDDDGLPDGSELYTHAFKTAQRFAIPAQGSVTVALPGVATGAPDFAIETADARLGLVHPRAGDLDVTLNRNGNGRSSSVDVAFPDAPNLFVSVDLLEAGFIPAELTTPAKWSLQITNAGERGTVEYFEIHIAARTSPIDSDSDGDGLNDTEETNPGDDGWITDPWRVDTDGDFISDSLEVQGWSRSETAIVADLAGFRTDPNRDDTDRDGFADNEDLDPLHDLMVRLTIGEYEALDNDPDLDDPFFDPLQCPIPPFLCFNPWPEPFVEVGYQGESFYTPHQDPTAMSVDLDSVYTLDVPDDEEVATLTLRAWDDDILADKQWDISPSESCEEIVTFALAEETTGEVTISGAGEDGSSPCGADFGGSNSGFDAKLTYQVDTVRLGRINTLLVDSLDVDDLLETPSGDLRYLGDGVFYLGWIEVTSDSGPFTQGLNAVLVPRAQFLNSSVNHTLQTASSAEDLPAYLKGLTFTVFNESAEETTNAIAGVLNGTLSGTAANLLLQDLIRGSDAVVNGNWTVVTERVVTLGLPDRVVNAIPLEGVRFDEAVGEGPGDLFSDFLDFLLDAAAFVGQGLVLIGTAIAAFFEQAVAFLGELGMAVLGAIAAFLGQVSEAVRTVGEALLEFASFVLDLIVTVVGAVIQALVQPVLDALDGFMLRLLLAMDDAVLEFDGTGTLSSETAERVGNLMIGPFFQLLFGLSTAVVLATFALLTTMAPVGLILNLVMPLVASLLLEALFGTVVEGTPFSFISDEVSMSAAITGASLFISLESSLASLRDSLETILVLLGLVFGSVAIGINAFLTLARLDRFGSVAVGLAITVIALTLVMTAWINVNAGSQAERRGGLFGLAVGGIAWSVLGLLLGFLAVSRAKLSFKALAILSFLLSFAALATSVSALLVVEALPNG